MSNSERNTDIRKHSHSCSNCDKTYTRKYSLEKHKILCDFKVKSSLEKQIDYEELGDIPNHLQLVKIIQELTLKYIKMEEKMEDILKWVDKKKKKLNVVDWLNTNVCPTMGYKEWVNTYISVHQEDFEHLMESSLGTTLQKVFEHNLSQNKDVEFPLRCFSQKANIFYICEKNEDGAPAWKQMILPDFVLLLKIIQHRMIKELTIWKKNNKHNFDDNDKIAELFNKAVIKLMNISFNQDANMTRIKGGLYNYLKIDLKSQIEYEFEF